jgi:Carboxypeptidase regulatory-like domain
LSRARTTVAVVGLAAAAALAAAVSLGWLTSGGGRGSDEARPKVSGPGGVPKPLATPGVGRVVGYVRDVNGNPLPGARVRVAGTRRGTTASSRGRYELPIPSGRSTLVAEDPAHTAQYVGLSPRPSRGSRLDFSLAVTEQRRAAGRNSADVLIFWTGCTSVASLSAGELDRLMEAGVDGFVCSVGRLLSMGGEHEFKGGPDARLRGSSFRLQRKLRDSAAVKRAMGGRLRLYLGFHASDYNNPDTPFKEWFDDRAWSRDVLTPVRSLAAAARSLGFVGVALDQELYPVSGGKATARWTWDYAGSGRSEHEVRAQVAKRGRQLMAAMLAGYPGLELVAYNTQIPGDWTEKVQEEVNGQPDAFAKDVRIDLWDGLSSVQGYSAIRWLDAIFYKSPHLGNDWSLALEYNANRIYSLLSRRWSNWPYASSRLHVTPFSWIDEGPSEFAAARDPGYVEDQLATFREWGTGGLFANYAYGGPTGFDYQPYANAMRDASTPGTVDQDPPTLSITSPADDGAIDAPNDRLDINGTAGDDFGIRVVRWYDGRGTFGTAKLTWDAEDDGDAATRWRIDGIPLSPGTNRITIVAEDIKGLARVRTLTVRR